MGIEVIMAGVTKYEQFANMNDAYQIEYNNVCGFKLYAVLSNPSPNEIENMIGNSDFTMSFSVIEEIGILSFMFDTMVGDCILEPHICGDNEPMDVIPTGRGIALNIIVIDSTQGGLVRGMRAIGLGEELSNNIREWYNEEFKKPFDKGKHIDTVNKIYQKYSPYDIIVRCRASWSLDI